MTADAKESFIASYKAITGKELTKDTDVKEFTKNVNEHRPLKEQFRELFPKKEKSAEEDIGAGMAGLFG